MDVKIAPDWKELLSPEFEKPYFAALTQFVRQEYATHRIYPRGSNIFRAFDKCPFDKLKVVIIGQATACRSRPRCKTSSRRFPTTPGHPSP